MRCLPESVEVYRRTPEFDDRTVPAALLSSHATKAGVWGRIRVLEGKLVYRILDPVVEETLLSPDRDGVVEPEVPHQVEPQGRVRFFVEFLR